MLTILSPAKNVNFDVKSEDKNYSEPIFRAEVLELVSELQKYDPWEIAKLMRVNGKIAELTFKRFMMWKKEYNLSNSKQSILAYSGTVYQALKAVELSEEELNFAQDHIRILSGLFGVLRPLDLMQPYRLEMGTKLKNSAGTNLYDLWRSLITDYFNKEIIKHKDNTLVNLASKEYSTTINELKFKGRIITPVFKEYNKGAYKIISVSAKRARGLMARFVIKNRINDVEKLKDFDEEGYYFEESKSTAVEWVFLKQL